MLLKVKGITLNVTNTSVINFESLKDLVLAYKSSVEPENEKTLVVEQQGVVQIKKYWDIVTRPLRKTPRCVCTRGSCLTTLLL
ncbi:hypothetical protein PRIEUP_LOCUS26, partial [Pristimantis euphronides]